MGGEFGPVSRPAKGGLSVFRIQDADHSAHVVQGTPAGSTLASDVIPTGYRPSLDIKQGRVVPKYRSRNIVDMRGSGQLEFKCTLSLSRC